VAGEGEAEVGMGNGVGERLGDGGDSVSCWVSVLSLFSSLSFSSIPIPIVTLPSWLAIYFFPMSPQQVLDLAAVLGLKFLRERQTSTFIPHLTNIINDNLIHLPLIQPLISSL
jgi:hypothetical protein